MKFVVRIADEEKTIVVDLSLLINNKSYLIESGPVKAEDGRYYARVMGRHYDVDVLDELLVAVRDAEGITTDTGDFSLNSPMPGLILDVKVGIGDRVEAGDPVVVMEAMKMQNELASEVSGVVKEIHVQPKQTVDSQTPLVTIERE